MKAVGSPRHMMWFSTTETVGHFIAEMRSLVDYNRSADQAERWLRRCKAEAIAQKDDAPEYWDKIKIVKVSLKVEVVPRTANAKSKAPKRRAGGKT
jgi:hypothetical protein